MRGQGELALLAQAAAEGLTLAEFHGGTYKTTDPAPAPVPSWTVVVEGGDAAVKKAADAVTRGRILGEASNLARGLSNEPGNTLTPREFAKRASAIASEAGVQVDILDEREIERLGMGMLLGVARGSVEPPRLMVFRYDPPGAPSTPVLGLVGKGITFDTGGISIKPADGMEKMKDDMAGGAAVACAMRAIALLKAPIRVIGIVPATENMPGGKAIKPGDVLKSAEGKTVEVINTDAEGRLILGDGLWYARQLGATHLVDVATLTGACVVALGKITSGLYGTPDEWVEQVRVVANRAGDRVWPMPVFDEYKDQLKSDIADLTNTGGRPAGSITAAMFLKEFTGGLPWAHLDIAGTAWADEAKPYLPKGASGVAVRTLAELGDGGRAVLDAIEQAVRSLKRDGAHVLQRRLIFSDGVEQRLGDPLTVGVAFHQLCFLRIGHERDLRKRAGHRGADQHHKRRLLHAKVFHRLVRPAQTVHHRALHLRRELA